MTATQAVVAWFFGACLYFNFWALWQYDDGWPIAFVTIFWPFDLARKLYRAGRQWWRS